MERFRQVWSRLNINWQLAHTQYSVLDARDNSMTKQYSIRFDSKTIKISNDWRWRTFIEQYLNKLNDSLTILTRQEAVQLVLTCITITIIVRSTQANGSERHRGIDVAAVGHSDNGVGGEGSSSGSGSGRGGGHQHNTQPSWRRGVKDDRLGQVYVSAYGALPSTRVSWHTAHAMGQGRFTSGGVYVSVRVCVCECASVGVGLRMGWQLACKLKIEFFAQLTLTLAARDMRVALGLLLLSSSSSSSSNADPLLTFVI